jgi:hypothetical protein
MQTEVKKFHITAYDVLKLNGIITIEYVDYTILQILEIEMDYEFGGADVTVLVYPSK